MSCLELEALDGNGRIALPMGETVIGRGPFLGIADKRVSRNHGLLEVVGEKLRIKSVHVNPCFYQPSGGKSQFVVLEKDKWQWLSEGDSFSLLPDKFVFKVISPHAEMDSTLSNSQNLDDEDELMKSDSGSDVQGACKVVEEGPSCSTNNISSEAKLRLGGTTQPAAIKAPCKNLLEKTKVAQRKRELPAWMLQGGLDVKPLQAPPAKTGARRGKVQVEQKVSGESPQGRKRSPPAEVAETSKDCEQGAEKKSRVKPEQKTAAPTQKATPAAPVSNVIDNLSANKENARSQKRDITEADDEDLQLRNQQSAYKQTPATQPSTQTSRRKGSDSEGQQGSLDKRTGSRASPLSPVQVPSTEDQEEKDTSSSPANERIGSASSADASQASVTSSSKRIPCVYAQQCYRPLYDYQKRALDMKMQRRVTRDSGDGLFKRKNPAHFQQFSHPGDSDYCEANEGSQDDNDERPECPFGTDCYRKNPQHKLEYKHTKPPETESRPTRRKTAQKGKSVLEDGSDDDGERNAYDLDDSFIDDEEEEYEPTDEDSDYEPDSEEKGVEDMDTLIKEANKFVKTKK